MRSVCLLLLAAVGAARGSDLRHYEDATLRAVHFADDREGWAVGDEGVIWHTIDAGKSWERQPSGTRGSLRSVHFVDPYIGWVAGREELPGGGATGVVLYTADGGVSWRRILMNSVPGLHLVRFVGPKTGYLAGDGSEQFPSGVFATTNGGRDWQPVPGPRASSWRGGDFTPEGGAMGGAWNRLATVRRGQVSSVDMDTLGGRTLTGLTLQGTDGFAVGQGGLVLQSRDAARSAWQFVDLKLGRDVVENLDLHAVSAVGSRVWAVGKPGSAVLAGNGTKWELLPTKQTMPLHGVYFRDEKRGWAVGELGTILATADGGKSWEVKQRGGHRLAVLCVHAKPKGAMTDVLATLGAHDGYLTGAVCVTGPEPASADLARVSEAARFEGAVRHAGGACAAQLWHFPVGSHLADAGKDDLIASWDKLHGDRPARLLLAQLVQAIRAYRPEVVVCDAADGGASALVHEAVKEALEQAGDAAAFDVQVKTLGLEPWKPRKAYAVSKTGLVTLDQTEVSPRLETTPREYGTDAAFLLGQETPPASRSFSLLASAMDGADGHKHLMQGISLAPGGVARRALAPLEELSPEAVSAVRKRSQLWAMADAPESAFNRPERMIADLGKTVAGMPDDVGARVAHGLGRLYAGRGQWSLAREAFFVLAERYPAHPLAIDGYRWLLMHQASGEVRRRYELGQFAVFNVDQHGSMGPAAKPTVLGRPDGKGLKLPDVPTFETESVRSIAYLSGRDDAKKWLEGCLALEKKLGSFGPLHAGDAKVGFCVAAARRQLGQVDEARKWYRDFAAKQPDGPWRQLAIAELWLAERRGPAPRPALPCGPAESRPYLDGKLDDECWKAAKALTLQDAAGKKGGAPATDVRMLYDRDYLYVAIRCAAEVATAEKKPRTRDEDLRAFDRVSVMLDVDRDYNTCYHLQVDARGCVAEDCWGDKSWNPKWFVAVHREPGAWTMEAAIPRTLLSGEPMLPGQAWAVNVVRTVPGRGVQAMALPAEAPEAAVRPEGMGLLLFTGEERASAGRR